MSKLTEPPKAARPNESNPDLQLCSADFASVVSAGDRRPRARPLDFIKDPSVVTHMPRGAARQNEVLEAALEISGEIPSWLVAEVRRAGAFDLVGTKHHSLTYGLEGATSTRSVRQRLFRSR